MRSCQPLRQLSIGCIRFLWRLFFRPSIVMVCDTLRLNTNRLLLLGITNERLDYSKSLIILSIFEITKTSTSTYICFSIMYSVRVCACASMAINMYMYLFERTCMSLNENWNWIELWLYKKCKCTSLVGVLGKNLKMLRMWNNHLIQRNHCAKLNNCSHCKMRISD